MEEEKKWHKKGANKKIETKEVLKKDRRNENWMNRHSTIDTMSVQNRFLVVLTNSQEFAVTSLTGCALC